MMTRAKDVLHVLPILNPKITEEGSVSALVYKMLQAYVLNHGQFKSSAVMSAVVLQYATDVLPHINEDGHKWLFEAAIDGNVYSLRKLMNMVCEPTQIQKIFWKSVLNLDDNSQDTWSTDWLSKGQLSSKYELIRMVNEHDLELGTVFMLGGWYASLAALMHLHDVNYDKIRSFDIDSACEDIARIFNKPQVIDGWKFQATTMDVMEMTYPCEYKLSRSDGSVSIQKDMPDTIINTSTEHMSTEWFDRIPKGTLVIIQNNDFFDCDGHINCVNNIDELRTMFPLRREIDSSTLDTHLYKRFTLIGRK